MVDYSKVQFSDAALELLEKTKQVNLKLTFHLLSFLKMLKMFLAKYLIAEVQG